MVGMKARSWSSYKKGTNGRRGGGRRRAERVQLRQTRDMVSALFEEDLHVKRVESLANGVHGVLHAARLSIHAIGAAYAGTADIQPKNGIKQVDRYLSNEGFDLAELLAPWAAFVVGPRPEALIALDWTEFDDDDHSTLAAYLLTSHGRATPLAWMTVPKSKLKSRMSKHERALLRRLKGAIPETVRVTIIADRGFAKVDLFRYIVSRLHWDYVIRIKGNTLVTTRDGRTLQAATRVPRSGRASRLVDVRLTGRRVPLPALVLKRDPRAKEPWCIATSRATEGAAQILKWYAKRFSIEETFRDQKDLRFGLGLRATHIADPARRDRLLLLAAISQALLTLLGAASEEAGLDRYLRANTVKRRTHSLFRQGSYWYGILPNMREEWFRPLITAFDRIVSQHSVFTEILAVI